MDTFTINLPTESINKAKSILQWVITNTNWQVQQDKNSLLIKTDKTFDPDDWIAFVDYLKKEKVKLDLAQGVFPVLNMSCAACAASSQSILQDQIGVFSANVNYGTQQAVVSYDANMIQPNQLKKAIQIAGFDLLIEDLKKDKEKQKKQKLMQFKQLQYKLIGAAIFAIPLFIIGMFFMNMRYANMIMFVLATPLVLYFGNSFFIRAYQQLRVKSANMDTLVALSTGVAYIYSLVVLFFPNFWHSRGIHAHVYFESAGIVIAFVLLGRYLEERAKMQTFTSLEKLMGLQVKNLWVIRNEKEFQIPVDEVLKDDVVVVKPGDKVPVDGYVIAGSSYVDESMITGEPIAVAKQLNSEVYAGTINQKGSFKILATKVGSQTLLSQIILKVEQAQSSKAPIQYLVDKVSKIFVPIVLVIATVSFFCWLFLAETNALFLGLNAFITVLVIACPCALGLATPTAIMVGMGKAAEKGILIQDAECLERAHNITTVVLDKTGTITKGEPKVQSTYGLTALDVQILYSIEKQSEHPLADAVVSYFKNETSYIDNIVIENIIGQGVKASYFSDTFWVGNVNLMHQNNVIITNDVIEWIRSRKDFAETIVYFAKNNTLLGVLAIADELKETSKQAIQHLQKMNLDVIMLTGDQHQTAHAIANQVGIKAYEAGFLPDQKADYITKLQQNKKVVAMVGDGVNDTNALAQADVSIAMGKGSDVAMNVAQMTIISSDLNKIVQAISISKQTQTTIKQNLFWAFIYNIIGIPIAAGALYFYNGFLLNPMWAGAAMALSSVSVVANSLRLKFKK